MEKLTMGKIVCMLLAVVATSLAAGCGTIGVQPQIKAEVSMKSGDKVHLFYAGPQDAKDMFCIGETVSVYRSYPQERLRYIEVGKVKVVRPIDKKYLEGVVVEGNVKEGDLARKSIAACKVLPPLPGRE